METSSGGAANKAVHQTQKGNGTEDQDKKKNMKVFGAFITGFILGVLIMWLISVTGATSLDEPEVNNTGEDVKDSAVSDSNTQDIHTGEIVVSPEDNKIKIADQIAGNRVLFESVSISQPGWLVIHENKEGTLGNALGARRYNAGNYTDGSVLLLRNTEVGNTYSAILYSDNGDKTFSLEDDKPLLNTDNTRIESMFDVIRIDRKI